MLEVFNTFSIWVIVGTPLCYLYFSSFFHSPINEIGLICLSLTVWGIYTLDHLMDGYKRKEYSLTLRHYIHYKYRKALFPLVTTVFIVVLVLAFFYLDSSSRLFGVAISIGILLYFTVNRLTHAYWKFSLPFKELGIAVVVTLCFVLLPNLHSRQISTPFGQGVLWAFGLINLANLYLFSFFDYEVDKKGQLSAISQLLSRKGLSKVIWICLLLSAIVLCWLFVSYSMEQQALLVLVLMLAQLIVVFLAQHYFSKYERYRFWGDLIYTYPVIYFLFL